ncbi:MAG: CHAT domain-containing protein, partial [Gammaproteobacteria bacterium]|nr:CHAT domain-containing protein [Gammaproteobacteria bacterium]
MTSSHRIHSTPWLAGFFLLLGLFIGIGFDALAAPLELRLQFRTTDGKTTVGLHSPGLDLGTDAHPFINPLASEKTALEDLRWYLENYVSWPVGPNVKRAGRVEGRLTDIGRLLFQATLGRPDAMRIWQQFRDHPDRPKHLTIDTRDPDVLRLPWELLADGQSHLFALDISIRRRVHDSKQRLTGPGFTLPLRILMVTARPQETNFIDPRIAPRALLDAVAGFGGAAGQETVVVEFLDTPSFVALSQRLRDETKPPVHVVHFDGHGKYDAVRKMGSLAFEDGKGHLDTVDAERLGTLMAKAGTPLLLLDACQSASVDGEDPFRGVAQRLIEAGAGAVVAMPYSVLVKTSQMFFSDFYRTLVSGETIGQAVDRGRWALLDNPARDEIYYPPEKDMVSVRLKDWFLPVLYQRAGDLAPFAEVADRALAHPAGIKNDCHFLEPRVADALLGGFPEPKYCFIGRSRELWALQNQLADHSVVVLHGLAGQGKTATASEAARWFIRTRHFAKAVFVSFEGGGDRDSALGQLGDALIGEKFAGLPREARLPALQEALAKEPVLIVWDNFESVLPGWEAALPADELQALLETGLALTGHSQSGWLGSSAPGASPQQSTARLLITT